MRDFISLQELCMHLHLKEVEYRHPEDHQHQFILDSTALKFLQNSSHYLKQ